VTILDRSFGNQATASTTWTVSRSTGTYGTGTVLVVAIIGNTVFNTPSGWTARTAAVNTMGLYVFDKTAAGEASINFVCSAAGTGQWYAWELSAGSTYLTSQATEIATTASTVALPTLTPTAGNRHMLGVGGGNFSSAVTVTGWSNSYLPFNGGRATAGDFTFSGNADRDMTTDGVTGVTSTATFSTGVNQRAAIHAAYINNAGDVTAPTVPTGLTTTSVSATSADLSWTASTDDTAVTGYELQIIGP